MNGSITALYLRLSSADENKNFGYTERNFDNKSSITDSNSIKNQRDLLTAFIKNHADLGNSQIIEICDDGFSGTNFSRPGIKKLFELVKNGDVNCVVVKDFSRFARNYIEAGDYIEQIFPFLGVRFISVNDNYDSYEQDISAGNLNVAFINLIHDLYSKDLSVKVKTAQRQKWEKGEIISAYVIYGYVKSPENKYKLVIDEPAAKIVRRIFDMAVNGCKTPKIAKYLNDNGILTPNSYKIAAGYKRDYIQLDIPAFWSDKSVRKIIADERYTGIAVFGKTQRKVVGNRTMTDVDKNEWIVKENVFESIISKDIFLKAQKILKRHSANSIKPENRRMIYKIVCGGCGRNLKRLAYKEPVFICRTPNLTNSSECFCGKFSEKELESVLFNTIRKQIEIFAEYENIDLSDSQKKELIAQIQNFRKSLQRLENERILLYESYKDEKIKRSVYLMEREKINSEIVELENKLRLSELEQTEQIGINPVKKEYAKFAECTKLTREMADCLVNNIIIYKDGKLEITLNCYDEFNIINSL